MVTLELMSENNVNDIYNFEKENRIYFEKTLPARSDEYYELKSFEKITNELIHEQNCGDCIMFIIRNVQGDMVGRINLTSIKIDEIKVAELGYRIGELEKGKGYATEATSQVLKRAFEEYGIEKVTASADVNNIASQNVLKKNEFILIGEIKKDIKVNDKWVDSLIFEISRYGDVNKTNNK